MATSVANWTAEPPCDVVNGAIPEESSANQPNAEPSERLSRSTSPRTFRPILNSGDIGFNVSSATPVKRRGKSMSRRTGQNGHLEKSGKWWVVRWWMDVPGQEERVLRRARVCPISGPGSLSESARTRAAVKSSRQAVQTRSNTSTRWLSNSRLLCSPSGSKRNAGLNASELVSVNPLQKARLKTGSAC